jgi:hypothetical protein
MEALTTIDDNNLEYLISGNAFSQTNAPAGPTGPSNGLESNIVQLDRSVLNRNYDGIKDEGVISSVVEYIMNHKSVEDENILKIKQITKIAEHILEQNPELLIGYLDRIYDYNIQGAKKIETAEIPTYSKTNLQNMHSHFYSHAGGIAKRKLNLSKSTDEKAKWAFRWYNSYKKSADIAKTIDLKHAAYANAFAGDAAMTLADITGGIYLMNEAQIHYEAFVTYAKNKKMRGPLVNKVTNELNGLSMFKNFKST